MTSAPLSRDAQIFLASLLAMILAAAICSFIVLKTLAQPPLHSL